ncbi:Pisatin demethylase, partial [Lachnellula suecica]
MARPIVRIAPDEYSIDDLNAVGIIYGLGGDFRKSAWYTASGSPDPHAPGDLFSTRDPQYHSALRRKIASLYAMSTLVKLEHYVDDCTSLLASQFEGFARTGEEIDLGHWLQCYAFDVIGAITLGKRFGFLDKGEDIGGIMNSIISYLIYASRVRVYSEYHRVASFLWPYLPGRKATGSTVVDFSAKKVEERLAAKTDSSEVGSDLLSRLVEMQKANPESMEMHLLSNLIRTPQCFRAVRDEIDQIGAEGTISDPVTFEETQKMPYLQAVIKESLRMHPATGLPLGRVVPQGGRSIAGQFIPEGTVVGINSWVAHANQSVFGTDASQFRPERWLGSKERAKAMSSYSMTFGAGSRTCIGKNISLLEIAKVIPQLVRNFELQMPNPKTEVETVNH